MYYFLVRFACLPENKVQTLLLDEETHTRWCDCEPQVGYKFFETIWQGEIDKILVSKKNYFSGVEHDE